MLTEPDPAAQADRKEPYTQIMPFQEQHDTSVEYVHAPMLFSAPPVLMTSQVFLQANHPHRARGRICNTGVCRDDPGRAQGGPREEAGVRPRLVV